MESAPSKMQVETSLASWSVGLSAEIIESKICVAQMMGLEARLALSIIHFWAMKTFSGGSSRASYCLITMMPSEIAKISSKLFKPSVFSILA